jgi:hypothetical protein
MPPVLNLPYLPGIEEPETLATPTSEAGLDLPALGGMVQVNRPHHSEVNNPGSSKPQEQGIRRMSVDQTMSVTMASSSSVNSDGQVQLPDRHAGSKGVTVSREVVPIKSSNGQYQSKNIFPVDQGMKVEEHPHGLAANVMADGQNAAMHSVDIAVTTPIATTHDGGRGHGKPSGLPRTVLIK